MTVVLLSCRLVKYEGIYSKGNRIAEHKIRVIIINNEQILFVDRFAPSVDALRLNCLQAGFCAAASGIVALFAEIVTLPNLLDCWLPLCYAGFLSMGAAYSLQIIGQKRMEPAAASLILSLESVFAVLFGWLLLHETMTPWEAIGCVLVFLAVILSQLNIKIKKKSLC